MAKPPVKFIGSDNSYAESISDLLELGKEQPVYLDLEASSLDPFTGTLILLQIGTESWVNIYDVRHLSEDKVKHLLALVEQHEVVGHNIKFDMLYIYEKYGVLLPRVYDTMLVEAILVAGIGDPYASLESLIKKYCNAEVDKGLRDAFIDNPTVQITPELIEYAADDVMYLPFIRKDQKEAIVEKKSANVFKLEMRLLPTVVRMEHRGVLLDKDLWKKLSKIATEKASELSETIIGEILKTVEKEIHDQQFENGKDMLDFFKVTLRGEHKRVAYSREYLGSVTDEAEMVKVFFDDFNPSSSHQMRRIMNLMGIPCDTTNSKYLKRDFGDNEFVALLISYREWLKLATSFGENFFAHINPKTGRIHSSFDQLATRTGRFASSKPNLQNIKRESDYRHSFIAPDDHVIGTYDYSQIELRLAAQCSQDGRMLSIFNEGRNMHTETAVAVFDMSETEEDKEVYTNAKSLNFAILYGTSARGIAYNFSLPHSRGFEILEAHQELFPDLHRFIDDSREIILERAYSATPFGRRRYFTVPYRFKTKNDLKAKFKIYKEGFNHIIQGGSADMLKIAMVKIHEQNPFGEKLCPIIQVHDEIVFEIHESIQEEADKFIREQMIEAGEIFITDVPVEVDGHLKPYWEK